MLSRLAFVLAWLRSFVRKPEHVEALAPEVEAAPEASAEADEPSNIEPAQQLERSRGAAQRQDHGVRAARTDPTVKITAIAPAQSRGPERETSPPRVLLGPRIDGGSSLAIECRSKAWMCWPDVKRSAERSRSAIDIVTDDGEVFEYALDRGKPGSGKLVIESGSTRIDLRQRWAEITITAEAAEVEGAESWLLREVPRVVSWLLGTNVEADELHAAGVRQRRIELCMELANVYLRPGMDRGVVSKAAKWQRWIDDSGGRRGFGAGSRDGTPSSFGLYDKLADLGRKRGAKHEALLARMAEAGLVEGEAWARLELRLWGEALLMVTTEGEDGRTIDATHPLTMLDECVLQQLWAQGLTQHWLADPTPGYFERYEAWEAAGRPKGKGPRMREEPIHPAWEAARAVAGGPIKMRRDLAARQREAVERHAMGLLARVGADVEDLRGGRGDGAQVRAALDEVILAPSWADQMARARARHRDVDRDAGK